MEIIWNLDEVSPGPQKLDVEFLGKRSRSVLGAPKTSKNHQYHQKPGFDTSKPGLCDENLCFVPVFGATGWW